VVEEGESEETEDDTADMTTTILRTVPAVPKSPTQSVQPPPRRSPRHAHKPPGAAPTAAASKALVPITDGISIGIGGKGEEARLRSRVVCLETALSAKDVEMATLAGTFVYICSTLHMQ
jgi:hypothetical protein